MQIVICYEFHKMITTLDCLQNKSQSSKTKSVRRFRRTLSFCYAPCFGMEGSCFLI